MERWPGMVLHARLIAVWCMTRQIVVRVISGIVLGWGRFIVVFCLYVSLNHMYSDACESGRSLLGIFNCSYLYVWSESSTTEALIQRLVRPFLRQIKQQPYSYPHYYQLGDVRSASVYRSMHRWWFLRYPRLPALYALDQRQGIHLGSWPWRLTTYLA